MHFLIYCFALLALFCFLHRFSCHPHVNTPACPSLHRTHRLSLELTPHPHPFSFFAFLSRSRTLRFPCPFLLAFLFLSGDTELNPDPGSFTLCTLNICSIPHPLHSAALSDLVDAVSYTHLTLPTNREV